MDGLEGVGAVTGIVEKGLTEATAKTLETVVLRASVRVAKSTAKVSTSTTRIMGAVRLAGGILEMGIGAATGLATSWTGVGALGGGLIVAHGADGASAGLTQLLTGKETQSYTEQGISKGLQKIGVSKGNADVAAGYADGTIGILLSAGGSAFRLATTERTLLKFAPAAAKTSSSSFKSFTSSNYRYNLQVLTGETGIGKDAHHIFPQAKRFQSYFQRAGINIHNPNNMTWWESTSHRSAASTYNKYWDKFFSTNPNATSQQIQNFGQSLMKKFGF